MTGVSPAADGEVPDVVIFGDFNCPFSALASARASELERRGAAYVNWRLVEHDPTIAPGGELALGDVGQEIRGELEIIRGLLGADEPDLLRAPSRRVNTARAVEAYAAAGTGSGLEAARLRERLFTAYWHHGRDISDPGVLQDLGAMGANKVLADRWRGEWQSLDQPIVPTMVLPDGYVSRGLGALARLLDACRGQLDVLRGGAYR